MPNYLIVTTTSQAAPVGTAINRIVCDPDFDPGDGLVLVEDDGRALFVVEAPAIQSPVPASVTNFQGRAILKQYPSVTPNAPAGRTLFDDVNDAIHAEPDSLAYQAWEYANEFDRSGATVTLIASNLGLSDQQIDAMFIAASTLTA